MFSCKYKINKMLKTSKDNFCKLLNNNELAKVSYKNIYMA